MHLTSEAEGRPKDVPWAILTREKTEEWTVKQLPLPWGQNNRKENAARTKASTHGREVSEVICA